MDGDNLSNSLKKPWRGAYNAAKVSPAYLAQHLASITIDELANKCASLALLDPLATRLAEISDASLNNRKNYAFKLSEIEQLCCGDKAVIYAAKCVAAEILLSESDFSFKKVRVKLYEEFCLAISTVSCLGVLETNGIARDIYQDASDASGQIEQTKLLLSSYFTNTTQELLHQNPQQSKTHKNQKTSSQTQSSRKNSK